MSSDTLEASSGPFSFLPMVETFLVEGVGLLQASWIEAEGLAGIARVKTSLALTRARARRAQCLALPPNLAGCPQGEDLGSDGSEVDGLEPALYRSLGGARSGAE